MILKMGFFPYRVLGDLETINTAESYSSPLYLPQPVASGKRQKTNCNPAALKMSGIVFFS